MCFHPSSPPFALVTVYLTPSGPVASPLWPTGLADGDNPAGVYTHGFGCCPSHLTVPVMGGVSGSLTAGGVPGSWSAGRGMRPVLTVGAGMTIPGLTGWSQRAAGAGHATIWFGLPYHGFVPIGS